MRGILLFRSLGGYPCKRVNDIVCFARGEEVLFARRKAIIRMMRQMMRFGARGRVWRIGMPLEARTGLFTKEFWRGAT